MAKKPMDLHLKKGALHKELGVKPGAKIPAKKIEKAEHSKNPLERKRAVFAENAKHWNHGPHRQEFHAHVRAHRAGKAHLRQK